MFKKKKNYYINLNFKLKSFFLKKIITKPKKKIITKPKKKFFYLNFKNFFFFNLFPTFFLPFFTFAIYTVSPVCFLPIITSSKKTLLSSLYFYIPLKILFYFFIPKLRCMLNFHSLNSSLKKYIFSYLFYFSNTNLIFFKKSNILKSKFNFFMQNKFFNLFSTWPLIKLQFIYNFNFISKYVTFASYLKVFFENKFFYNHFNSNKLTLKKSLFKFGFKAFLNSNLYFFSRFFDQFTLNPHSINFEELNSFTSFYLTRFGSTKFRLTTAVQHMSEFLGWNTHFGFRKNFLQRYDLSFNNLENFFFIKNFPSKIENKKIFIFYNNFFYFQFFKVNKNIFNFKFNFTNKK